MSYEIDLKQKKLAETYYKDIRKCLDKLSKDSPDTKKQLEDKLHYQTIAAAVLPLLMTLISGLAFIVTQQAITFITNLVDVVPPMLIQRTTTNIEGLNQDSEIKNRLFSFESKINRLVILGQLKGDLVDKVNTEMESIIKAMPC